MEVKYDGAYYRVQHKRKGPIIVRSLSAEPGDDADPMFWLVEIEGGGKRLLRPSQITGFEEITDGFR